MSNILIFEGFDLVGKTTFARTKTSSIYRPDYSILDKYYTRNLAFMFGYAQADIWSFCKENNLEVPEQIAMDRGLFSSYVYSRIYNDNYPELNEDIVVSYVMKLVRAFDKVDIYDVRHRSRESAKLIYEYNLKHNNDHNEEYDQFEDIGDYYSRYDYALELFDDIYSIVKSRLPRSSVESFDIHYIESYVVDGELKFEEVDHS